MATECDIMKEMMASSNITHSCRALDPVLSVRLESFAGLLRLYRRILLYIYLLVFCLLSFASNEGLLFILKGGCISRYGGRTSSMTRNVGGVYSEWNGISTKGRGDCFDEGEIMSLWWRGGRVRDYAQSCFLEGESLFSRPSSIWVV